MAGPTGTKINSRGPCYWCVRAVKWIPVLFITTIVIWSYYAYVVQLCIGMYIRNIAFGMLTSLFLVTIESDAKKVLFLIFYHILFIMFFWSYFQTIFIDVGRVPDKVSHQSY